MVQFAQAKNHRETEFQNAGAESELEQAEALLAELAGVFNGAPSRFSLSPDHSSPDSQASNLEAKYRALLEQLPAVVFMAYVDRGTSEAYVSPEIEAALGYSRE